VSTATADTLAEMERVLVEGRDTMTLTERVNARRAIDAAAGTVYTAPGPLQVQKIARTMHTGMRRIRATD
jgi:FtsZ-interacting cell division protein YlmF